jgi:ribosomal protein L37AE/L43A
MSKESKQESPTDITCKDCGKTNGQVKVGTHWICEDCKIVKIA